jgi:hypothetical protein
MDCTYCGSDVHAHDPLFLEAERDGERESVGQFCNYACLTAHVEEERLAVGDACEFDPSE